MSQVPCSECRPATFGHFLCDRCREVARRERSLGLAGARVLVSTFAGIFGEKSGGRGSDPRPPNTPDATERNAAATTEHEHVAAPTKVSDRCDSRGDSRRRGRRFSAASDRYVSLATDGQVLVGLDGRRVEVGGGDSCVVMAAAARQLAGGDGAELIVFIHPAAHDGWGLPAHAGLEEPPAFFAGATRVGPAAWAVPGAPKVYFLLPAHSGDFAGAADVSQLLAAVEAFRQAVGMAYLFSGASTLHKLIKARSRPTIPPPEPDLTPPYTPTAYAVPAHAWHRPLADGGGWVRAFDRSGSYLAAWRGVTLSDGPWEQSTDVVVIPGPESGRPPGYWLVSEATRAAVTAAAASLGLPDPLTRWAGPDAPPGPLWATTPLLQLVVDILGEAIPVDEAWITPGHCRALDVPGEVLGAARTTLAAGTPADRIALDVVKVGYAAAVAWLEYGPGPGDALHRPHWRRTLLDRHVANTYRGLQKATTAPFALTGVDCALFAVDGPDTVPEGLRIGTGLGAWKPKGQPVPAAAAADALADRGVAAVMQLVGA